MITRIVPSYSFQDRTAQHSFINYVLGLAFIGIQLVLFNSVLALYVRECFDCTELNNCGDEVKSLWVRMRGKANKTDILLRVCYRQLNQDEEIDEAFCKWLEVVSQSLALVLVEVFSLLDICWKYNTAERKQSRRFLECVEDNVLTS